MIVGTLFTLFVVPSIYMVIARDRRAEEIEAGEDDLLDELEPVSA